MVRPGIGGRWARLCRSLDDRNEDVEHRRAQRAAGDVSLRIDDDHAGRIPRARESAESARQAVRLTRLNHRVLVPGVQYFALGRPGVGA